MLSDGENGCFLFKNRPGHWIRLITANETKRLLNSCWLLAAVISGLRGHLGPQPRMGHTIQVLNVFIFYLKVMVLFLRWFPSLRLLTNQPPAPPLLVRDCFQQLPPPLCDRLPKATKILGLSLVLNAPPPSLRGREGAGKTAFVSLWTARSRGRGLKSCSAACNYDSFRRCPRIPGECLWLN